VNSKEENSQDFFLDFVQEFGLRSVTQKRIPPHLPFTISTPNRFILFAIGKPFPKIS
jgi:hypothetical protein